MADMTLAEIDWRPTMRLRWIERGPYYILQQLWVCDLSMIGDGTARFVSISPTGGQKEEWRDVPSVHGE